MPIQFCPDAQKAPDTVAATALSRSLSAITITGALPPKSIVIFFNPAVFVIASPVVIPPVKETIRILLADTNSLPTLASPTTTEIICLFNPARAKASTSLIADSGVSSEGFKIIEFPAATAGPNLCATRLRGSLNGVIANIIPRGSTCV